MAIEEMCCVKCSWDDVFYALCQQICLHYNKGDGPFGSCSFQKQCIKLHICQYYLQGECKFGTGCKRSHEITNSENLQKLEKLGISSDMVSRLLSTYRNAYDIKNMGSALSKVPPSPVGSPGTSGKAAGKCCGPWACDLGFCWLVNTIWLCAIVNFSNSHSSFLAQVPKMS